MASVWLDRLFGARLSRCRLAHREYQPVVLLTLEHDRLPGRRLDFTVKSHDLHRERGLALFAELLLVLGLRGSSDSDVPPRKSEVCTGV